MTVIRHRTFDEELFDLRTDIQDRVTVHGSKPLDFQEFSMTPRCQSAQKRASVCENALFSSLPTRERLQDRVRRLTSIRERLELFEEGELAPAPGDAIANSTAMTNRRVFIVHGRDDAVRLEVWQCLTRLKLEPVVLFEETNDGKTVIEKFERCSDVGYAGNRSRVETP